MMEEANVRDTIRRFVSETFLVEFGVDAEPDTDLFEADFIDSFGFVDLVNFIESSFGVKLNDDDLESPLIGSLSGIQTLTLYHLSAIGQ